MLRPWHRLPGEGVAAPGPLQVSKPRLDNLLEGIPVHSRGLERDDLLLIFFTFREMCLGYLWTQPCRKQPASCALSSGKFLTAEI